METLHAPEQQPSIALRALDIFLWVCFALLTAATLAVLVFSVAKPLVSDSAFYARGSTTEVVVGHTTPDGRQLLQDLSVNGASPVEPVRFLSANVQAEVDGAGPKIVLAIASLASLALAWCTWINIKRLTRSSLAGNVFTHANSKRIARLGWIACAYPLLGWWISKSVFASVAGDEQIGVTGFLPQGQIDDLVAWIGVGLLLHAIAQAFRRGVELRELEAATI